mgnify:CR=1 FL=1
MLDKTITFKKRFDELTELISKPEIIADQQQWKKLVKERSGLEQLAEAHDSLERLVKEKDEIHKTLESETDPERSSGYCHLHQQHSSHPAKRHRPKSCSCLL